MRFEIDSEDNRVVRGRCLYVREDFSFVFEPESERQVLAVAGTDGIADLTIDTLQIMVSVDTGQLLWAAGYWPIRSWRKVNLITPDLRRGSVFVKDAELVRSVGIGLDPERRWTASHRALPSTSARRLYADAGQNIIY